MEKIGFIGLGNMGGEMAKAIADKGYALTVFDVDNAALARFKGIAGIAGSAVDTLRSSDIVFLSLPSSKIVEPIIDSFIIDGVAGKIIVDTSTSYPLSTRRLYEEIKAKGGMLADVTISGMPNQAKDAKLMGMFGGGPDVFERLRPVVACFADRFMYMGESGNGHVTKLIFNFIALSYVNTYAMAFSLTERMGLDNGQLLSMLQTTGMGCGILNFYAPKMIDGTYDLAFALELAHKDLTYVKQMFEEYQVPAYALDGVLDLLRTSIRDGKGKQDYSACMATMREFFEKA